MKQQKIQSDIENYSSNIGYGYFINNELYNLPTNELKKISLDVMNKIEERDRLLENKDMETKKILLQNLIILNEYILTELATRELEEKYFISKSSEVDFNLSDAIYDIVSKNLEGKNHPYFLEIQGKISDNLSAQIMKENIKNRIAEALKNEKNKYLDIRTVCLNERDALNNETPTQFKQMISKAFDEVEYNLLYTSKDRNASSLNQITFLNTEKGEVVEDNICYKLKSSKNNKKSYSPAQTYGYASASAPVVEDFQTTLQSIDYRDSYMTTTQGSQSQYLQSAATPFQPAPNSNRVVLNNGKGYTQFTSAYTGEVLPSNYITGMPGCPKFDYCKLDITQVYGGCAFNALSKNYAENQDSGTSCNQNNTPSKTNTSCFQR